MRYLLDFIYLCALLLFSPFLIYKAIKSGKLRRGLWRKLTGAAFLRPGSAPCVWIHGVSVGEIHLLRQLVARFRQRHPDWECVISTTTDTGYDEACRRFPELAVFFWPLDFSWAVTRAIRRVRPTLIVLAESELWPNALVCAKRERVPVAVINARMSPRSARNYRRFGLLARSMVRLVDAWAVQTDEYAANLCELGALPERVRVTGSVKYDGIETNRRNARTREMGELLGVAESDLVMIAGSTQAPEEQIALDIFQRLRTRHPNLRLILVPRQKDRFDEVAKLLQSSGIPYTRRSEIRGEVQRVVLVDTIGELSAIWGLADVAFVGGSLDGQRGGQNMIEPAGYGAAVLFGPHTWNFKDTVTRLVEANGAIQVADAAELEAAVTRLLTDADERRLLGSAAQQFVLSQQGATERTLDVLDQVLTTRPKQRRAA